MTRSWDAGGEQEGVRLIFPGPCRARVPLSQAAKALANVGRRSSCLPAATRRARKRSSPNTSRMTSASDTATPGISSNEVTGCASRF